MALHEDGTLYIWGNRSSYDGKNSSVWIPISVRLPRDVPPSSFGAGQNHCFMIFRDGSLFLWGDNSSKQLGREEASGEMAEFGGEKFRVPMREEAWRVAQWMFLGRADGESNFFLLPVEILFHFVSVVL
jgi:alpha-tubulin suppressor-like RCC1 family protein